MVQTDISNFFPSIYSHAIPWAVVGLHKAKQQRGQKTWFDTLDKAICMTRRAETQGINIGPATSNVLSEILLARVDKELSAEFTFTRFTDDYAAYCKNRDEAQEFVLRLTDELHKYKLSLNINKTAIIPLPQASIESWVATLSSALPDRGKVSAYAATNYLESAINLAHEAPDGSVLKYAIKSLMGAMRLKKGRKLRIRARSGGNQGRAGNHPIAITVRYALNLAFHQPVLLPLLEQLIDASVVLAGRFRYGDEIQALMCEHTHLRHSDAISWLLYLSMKYGVEIKDCCAAKISKSGDCIPLLLLYLSQKQDHKNMVVDHAEQLDKSDLYELDRYWLLLYQLFLEKMIANPYKDKTFEIMKSGGVDFVQQVEAS